MACETFLKICQRCKQQFVKQQPQEQSPFIDQLLVGSSTVADIGSTIADLEAHQVAWQVGLDRLLVAVSLRNRFPSREGAWGTFLNQVGCR